MNTNENSIEDRGADSVRRLVRLAEACPVQYPPEWHGWENHPAVRNLSEALQTEYPNLAKAALQGKDWPRTITWAESEMDLRRIENDASSPGWSWMKPNDQAQPPRTNDEK